MVKNTTEKATAAEQRHTNEQKYKGVRKRKWGKWVSEIRLPNSRERIWLGSFDSPVKAARAFDAAMYCLRGRTANFNFPDNPPEIPGGRSLTSSEIQIAAARFANTEESVGGESDLSMHEHDMSHAEQMERSRSQSPSSSVLSEGTFVQMETESGSGSGSGLEFHSGTYGNMLTKMDSGNFASDFGLFPEFDYMNMGNEFSTTEDYICEENFDVNVDNYLWNF